MAELNPPVYLAELLVEAAGDVEFADVFARLDTAVDAAYRHAQTHGGIGCYSEVSVTETGEIDGVGFFTAPGDLIAFVTVYQMEHDQEEPQLEVIRTACLAPPAEMQSYLNSLLGA